MKNAKTFLGVIVLLAIISSGNVLASAVKKGEFHLNFSADKQRVSLSANEAKLSEILTVISKKAELEVRVYEKEDKLITADFKNEPIDIVLKRIIRNNYVFVYNGNKLQGVGLAVSSKKVLTQVKEFLGRIMEDGRFIKMFFAPPDFTPEGIARYIKDRHAFLDYLAEEYPQKDIQTQFSFRDFIGVDELKKIAIRYPEIQIQEVNPGWKDWKGGFGVDPQRTLNEELAELQKMEQQTVSQRMEHAQQIVNAEKAEGTGEISEGSKQFLRDLEERQASLQTKGVTLYGMKASGKAEDIKRMRDELECVRLADPIFGGKLAELLSKTHIVHQIPIALSPYDNPVSEMESK